MHAFNTERAHLYDGIVFSKQQEKRQPPTVVSLALRFYKSMQEIAESTSVDLSDAPIGKKDVLLEQVFDECAKHGVAAVNDAYQLNPHMLRGIRNIILFASGDTVYEIQRLLNCMEEGATPFVGKNLGSNRWLLGGEPPRTRATLAKQWVDIRTMTALKQVLFLKTIGMEIQVSRKSGKSGTLDLEEWNNIANYACWCGQGVQWMMDDGLLVRGSDEFQRLTQRIAEKDFWDKYTGHWMLQDDDFEKTSYPFWPVPQATEQVLAKDESSVVQEAIAKLDEKEQDTAFKKDMLGLTSDQSRALTHVAHTAQTQKALRIARAGQAAKSISEGRSLVVEPYMKQHCDVHVLEKPIQGETEYNDFQKKKVPAEGGEKQQA